MQTTSFAADPDATSIENKAKAFLGTMQLGTIESTAITRLRPYASNARTHSRKQVRQIADSITRFGFTNPVLISDEYEIIAGHGRVEAAKILGLQNVPAVRLSHLDAAQRRAYVLADNKLALNAGWDYEVLAIELQALVDLDFGVEVTGFSLAEVDLVLEEARESSADPGHGPDDAVPPLTDPAAAVTVRGDLWQLGRHQSRWWPRRSKIAPNVGRSCSIRSLALAAR
jgi:ParB-like chromosome segregation protein Spo0J